MTQPQDTHPGRPLAAVALVSAVTLFFGAYLLHWRDLPLGDISDNFYYIFAHLGARYRSGGVPLWSQNYYAGHPFFGNMPSIFYPADALFALFPPAPAFAIDRALHLALGAVGMYAAGRRLGLTPAGAVTAGLLYTCSGFTWEHVRGGHVYIVRTAMWFPVVLWALLALWDGTRARRALGVSGLCLGLFYLSGHPQIFTYGTLAIGVLTLTGGVGGAGAGWRGLGRRVGLSAGAGLLGVLIAAIQLVPLTTLAGQTSRGHGGLDLAGGLSWPALGWLHTVWPQLMITAAQGTPPALMPHAELGVYIGAMGVTLAVLGLTADPWRGFRLCVAAVLLGGLYALGRHTPLLRAAVWMLPPLGQFRIPSRILFLAVCGVALLAGRGVDVLGRAAGVRRRAFPVALLACGATVVVAGVILRRGMATDHLFTLHILSDGGAMAAVTGWSAPALLYPCLSLIIAPAVCWALWRYVRPDVAGTLAVGCVLVNLWAGLRTGNALDFAPPPTVHDHADVRAVTPAGRVFIRRSRSGAMASLLTGQRNIDGSGPFLLSRLDAYLRRAAGVPRLRSESYELDPALVECGDVGRYRLLNIEGAICTQDGESRTVRLDSEHAWFATEVRQVRDEVMALAAVTSPDFDPARTVVLLPLAAATAGLERGGPAQATWTLLEDAPHTQTWRLESDARGVFVVSELDYPGWRVYVNDEPRESFRADFLLRGVVLDPGSWTVTWRYQPLSVAAGAALSVLGLVLAIGLCRPTPPAQAHARHSPA